MDHHRDTTQPITDPLPRSYFVNKDGAGLWDRQATAHRTYLARRHGERLGASPSPRGEDHPSARLTDEAVRQIRATYADLSFGMSARALGRQFGVSEASIRNVLSGRTWSHVEARP